MRPFRFGYQIDRESAGELVANAREAEAAGFDVVHSWDHVVDGWSPLAPLLAVALATERVRVCPLVLNNDFHHPVHLARELASIDHLSGGRLELGTGAGHSLPEYTAIGSPFDPPRVRKARLAEAVEILRRLLDGETVTCDGEHYRLDDVRTQRSMQEHLPFLVGVNGAAALTHAAQHADIVGLTMLGRTLPDGNRHAVRWESERLDSVVAHVREQAGARWPLELQVLVQVVEITDDRVAAAERLAASSEGLSVEDALATPFLALGTHDEIAEQYMAARARWGISYLTVRSIEPFAPVIERLRTVDHA